jgi:SAM-dependent methyltransferase
VLEVNSRYDVSSHIEPNAERDGDSRVLIQPRVENLLYSRPELYELVYPEPDEETPNLCRRLFARYLSASPTSILDIGCGTGRDLAGLARDIPDCWGVDASESMLGYARTVRPGLTLQLGDMRSVRLGRTFDVITCLGSVLMYALDNADVQRALETFVVHAHDGTLLILDLNNAMSFLGDGWAPTQVRRVDTPAFSATARIRNTLDRRRQHWIRERTWQLADGSSAEDYCVYRLFFPAELEHLLAQQGFRTLGVFDNITLDDSDFTGSRAFVAAIHETAEL